MKEKKDYYIQDLLSESEEILKGIGPLDEELESELKDKERGLADRTAEALDALESDQQDYKVDGSIDITVSMDDMSASADFYPPSEGRIPISYNDISEKLADMGICHGIDKYAIEEAVFECNTEHREVRDVVIASGTEPRNEVPGHYVIEERLLAGFRDEKSRNEQIDYRKQSPFVLVKKGEILARSIPLKEGMVGKTVLGEEIAYRIESVEDLVPGENTGQNEEGIVAARDGRFELEAGAVKTNEVLQISGDVDYSTGHIDFPGDVMIKGQIQDGFRVNSGSSIFIGGTMDASTVECEKDLVAALGIIGRKEGTVKVGGSIKAKFIENCCVEAGNLISLSAGILNSSVYTADKLVLGRKGIIVGGTVYSQNGVVATQIGTKMGPKTEIYCGTDYVVANRLEWIRDNNMKLALKLNQIDLQLKKGGPENPQLEEVRQKLKESMHKLNEMASSLVFKLDKNDNAEVLVRGKVYPGVYIEICHTSYVVDREMSSVRFKLSKEKGKIVAESI